MTGETCGRGSSYSTHWIHPHILAFRKRLLLTNCNAEKHCCKKYDYHLHCCLMNHELSFPWMHKSSSIPSASLRIDRRDFFPLLINIFDPIFQLLI
ncbi:MAG TPA: hypothetical protein DCL15_20430 [Chloroflexi bacterium]|nr:hypothetical protein [Chloroflexota bacterium]